VLISNAGYGSGRAARGSHTMSIVWGGLWREREVQRKITGRCVQATVGVNIGPLWCVKEVWFAAGRVGLVELDLTGSRLALQGLAALVRKEQPGQLYGATATVKATITIFEIELVRALCKFLRACDCHVRVALKLANPSCGGIAPTCTLRSCALDVYALT